MRENVGTFFGKAETGAPGVSFSGLICVKSIFVLFESFLPRFANLRLVFACLCAVFRRYREISTTACALLSAAPQSSWSASAAAARSKRVYQRSQLYARGFCARTVTA